MTAPQSTTTGRWKVGELVGAALLLLLLMQLCTMASGGPVKSSPATVGDYCEGQWHNYKGPAEHDAYIASCKAVGTAIIKH